MTVLAVFKSRAQALDCISLLRKEGVPAQPVANPPQAKVGCGISARFEDTFLPRVRRVISKKSYSAFAGYMRSAGNSYLYL